MKIKKFVPSKQLFQEFQPKKAPHNKALNEMVKKTQLSESAREGLSNAMQDHQKPIQWHRTGNPIHPFQTQFESHNLRLQINDFPDEPFCTVQRNLSEQPDETPDFKFFEDIIDLNGYAKNWEMLDKKTEPDTTGS